MESYENTILKRVENKPKIKTPIKRSKKINKIQKKNLSTPIIKKNQPIQMIDENINDKKVTFSDKIEFKNLEDSDSGTDIEDFKNML